MVKSLYKVDRQMIRINDEDREVIVGVETIVQEVGKITFTSSYSTGSVTLSIESARWSEGEIVAVRILLDTFQGEGTLFISVKEDNPTHKELLEHGIVEIVCIAPQGDYADAILWIGNSPDPEENTSGRLKNTLLEWHETPPQITTIKELLG